MKPICVDLFCGLGGWTEGFLAEGWQVVGFDIERHDYGTGGYPAQLVIQDALTIHGRQFKDAACIVASPPCQAYSYRAMPWKRAKALPPPSNELFETCFRIQAEAEEAAGHHIPLIVENVCGAQKWVGRAKWHYGSFYLWGDVPALMPMTMGRQVMKNGVTHRTDGATNFHGQKVPAFRFDGSGRSFQTAAVKGTGGGWFDPAPDGRTGQAQWRDGVKGSADQLGGDRRTWFDGGLTRHGSKSTARKAASAMIAKIPLPLSRHIARCYYPTADSSR